MRIEAHGRRAWATVERGALAERLSRAYVAHALVGALPRRRAQRSKRTLDLALALPIYVLTAPLRFTAAIPFWLREHRRANVPSACAGCGGRAFTMRQMDQPAQRLTTPNAWLGASQLAKTPALAHVLSGHMSLVGPAPWTLEAIASQWDKRDLARLYVAPGVITLRPFGALRRLATTQAEADLRYVTHGSLMIDVQQIWAAAFLYRRRYHNATPPLLEGEGAGG